MSDFKKYNTEKILAVMDARRNEVYACTFLQGEPLSEVRAKVLDTDDFDLVKPNEKIILIGDGAQKVFEFKKNYNFILLEKKEISASFMSQISFKKFKANKFEITAYFEPDYLKPYYTGGKYIV